ncbi:MAG TPA: FAD-dependent oxidoreductase [Acidimicrobiales bacterium]|nr:FAD-dependent oxidoreductase [Acidimicrobiales bacterium]
MRVAVVGASVAGWRAARALREQGYTGGITVIGGERHRPYDRPPLSKQLLTGKVTVEQLALEDAAGLDLDVRLGVEAAALDLGERRLGLADGTSVDFDGLILATGAAPRSLPGTVGIPGVHLLRTLDQSLDLRAALLEASRLVVVGAGFIGLEVASSAAALGVEVTVLEAAAAPVERAVGAEVGGAVAAWHRRHGIDVRVGTGVAGLETDPASGRVTGVRLAAGGAPTGDRSAGDHPTGGAPTGGTPTGDDTAAGAPTGDRSVGKILPADVVVIGIGAAPVTGWLTGSGVDLDGGIRTDSRLRVLAGGTPLPWAAAAGDVARWDHPVLGRPVRAEHWTNAVEQGDAAALALLRGDAAPNFAPIPYVWSDQLGSKLQVVGDPQPEDEVQVVDGSLDEDRWVVAYGREGRLTAAAGLGRPARVMKLRTLLATGASFPLNV